MLLTQFKGLKVGDSKNQLSVNFNNYPKIEHHVHAEGGTLTPQTLTFLANKNGLPVPDHLFAPNNTIAYKDGDFIDFLRAYDNATDYILTFDDVYEVTYRYLKKCHEEGAIYVELMCSPDHGKRDRKKFEASSSAFSDVAMTSVATTSRFGVLTYQDFVNAIAKAIDAAKMEFGIEARMLMVLLRHQYNIEGALDNTMQEILGYLHPYVVGIHLAGDEFAFKPALFTTHFQQAKAHGLKLAAHAGEHADGDSVVDAIHALALDRIGHGVRAIESPKAMALIKERGIALELCPTSNLKLRLYESIEQHPLPQFLAQGVKFSINSDDPGFFGRSLGQEHDLVQKSFNLSDAQMLEITKNAILTSFCSPQLMQKLIAHHDLYCAYHALKQSLQPFSQNDVYACLEGYGQSLSHTTLQTLKESCERTCSDSDNYASLKKQVESLENCHASYEQACDLHEKALAQSIQAFEELQIAATHKKVQLK
ncbi:MAG: adenosine deaminase [Candidatus Berkiella sp.]